VVAQCRVDSRVTRDGFRRSRTFAATFCSWNPSRSWTSQRTTHIHQRANPGSARPLLPSGTGASCSRRGATRATSWTRSRSGRTTPRQGLTLAHFRAQLEDLREHIAHVTAQLEHLRDTSTGSFGLYGGQSEHKLSGNGQSELKLSGNGSECAPLPCTPRRSCPSPRSPACQSPRGSSASHFRST